MIAETSTSLDMAHDLLKRLLYGSGALGLYHRVRNARTLTVIMFHRVLDPGDRRWSVCDPDYTLAAELFARSLEFFRRHYTVVSAQQVLDARRSGARLPPRALLITFDDGWADNVDHALPHLERAGFPALMFAVSDAVDGSQPFFQERMVSAWRRGVLPVSRIVAALSAQGIAIDPPVRDDMATLRTLIQRVEQLAMAERERLLGEFAPQLSDGTNAMVSSAQLRLLAQRGVAIGAHGKTHEPLTRVPDPEAELRDARVALAAHLQQSAPPVTMSFPHGKFDTAIAGQARAAGYELLFTSVPAINAVHDGTGWLLARLGIDTESVTDSSGRFRPDMLALYLFKSPQRVLAA